MSKDPQWALFYDFHTMPAIPDVGANFDVERFTDRIAACGVDYLVFAARCNLGMAYFNTTVGIRHPSLQYDLIGRLAESCRAKSITFSAYVNAGLSHEEGLLHRDWTVLTPEGYTHRPDTLDHFFRMMCYNSPYGDHLLELVRELVSGYPIAGLFLDCMNLCPCVGVECIREMKERGIDWEDPVRVREFAHFSRVRMTRRIAEAALALKPELLLYFNGIPYEDQEPYCSYYEFECLPTGGWGYESFPAVSRYLRTLGKPVLNMTGRFHQSWGDFGGIRTEASLEFDCLQGIANGMRPTIGGHLHPRGDINDAVFDLIEPIYGRLQKLDPWTVGADPIGEVAVVMPIDPPNGIDPEPEALADRTVKGAARMLCELKLQFDIVSAKRAWDGYQLLVLPDEVLLDESAAKKIRVHLDAGGSILSSGWSGLDREREAYVFSEWGLVFGGDHTDDPAYYSVREPLRDGIPDMPNNFYCQGTRNEAQAGTEVLATLVRPYFNRHWDGEHGHLYLPPDRETNHPAVTRNGNVAHISHAVFRAYHDDAPVPLRQIVANLIKSLLPNPIVRARNLPSFARVTVTGQRNRRMVHVLSYVPERRGPSIEMIEEPIELRDVEISLRADDAPPARVYLAPSEDPLPHVVQDGYVSVTIPVVSGYALVVVEQ